jgi:hypothetical protein
MCAARIRMNAENSALLSHSLKVSGPVGGRTLAARVVFASSEAEKLKNPRREVILAP